MVEEKQEGGRILPPPPGKIGLSVTTQSYDNSVKKGVNLPTTQREWEIANSFIHSELPINEVNKVNLNNVTEKFNRIVYD